MTETKLIPCPVHGCRQQCRTPDTLLGHLYGDHNKSEISEALARLVCYVLGRPIPE